MRAATAARSTATPDVVFREVERRRHAARQHTRFATIAISVVVVAVSVGSVLWAAGLFGSHAQPDGTIPADLGDHVPSGNGRLLVAGGGTLRWVDPGDGSTEPFRLPSGIRGDVWGASFSPVGTKLALKVFADLFTNPDDPGSLVEERSVWVVDLATGDAVQIGIADNVSTPSWSPDGQFLVYRVEEGRRSSIRIASSDGSVEQQVGDPAPSGTTYFSPSISPDGTRIAYGLGTDATFDLFSMAIDGSDVAQLTEDGKGYEVAWSPDGSRIAFTRQEDAMQSDIYLMDADGRQVRALTHGGKNETNLEPVWSPDGAFIAFVLDGGNGDGGLAIVPASGGRPTVVLPHGTGVLGIAWQPSPA